MTQPNSDVAVEINAIIMVDVQTTFSLDDKIWDDGFIGMSNCSAHSITTIGVNEADSQGRERFSPVWMIIVNENNEEVYSGCPEDFGSLSTEAGSFFDVGSSALPLPADEDAAYNILDAVQNLILFPTLDSSALFSKEYRASLVDGDTVIDLDEMELEPSSANNVVMYVCRQMATFAPEKYANQLKAIEAFKRIVDGHVDDWRDEAKVAGLWVRTSDVDDVDSEEGIPARLVQLERAFWESFRNNGSIEEIRRKLDYTPESLKDFDNIISQLWNSGKPHQKAFDKVVAAFGAYVARVIEKQFEGYWFVDDKGVWNYQFQKTETVPNIRVAPFSWMHKRLEDGDMLAEKYQKMIEFMKSIKH